MKKENYTFVVLQDQLSCYHYSNNIWEIESIDGERNFELRNEIAINWNDILDKLNKRHNSEHNLANVSITLIRSNKVSSCFVDNFSAELIHYKCSNWQILLFEEWLSPEQISSLDSNIIYQDLLPKTRLIESLTDITQENEESIELILQIQQLEQQKKKLLKDIQEAKEQRLKEAETKQAPDTSYLVTYLPLFFSDIWTKITMSDIACFSESLEIPEIPSPYQEPSNDCLHRLKRRFQQLSLSKQAGILECCQDLQHQYEVRRLAYNLLENNNEK